MYFWFYRTREEIRQEGFAVAKAHGYDETAEILIDLYEYIYKRARKKTREEIAQALVVEGCSYSFAARICVMSDERVEELYNQLK